MSRPGYRVEHLIVQLVVAPEIHSRTLAEIDDARLAHAVGIVEDVLKAQCIGGIGVFIIIFLVNETGIVGGGVTHHTDVGIVGNTAVWRHHSPTLSTTSGSYSGGVGAVSLRKTVARMLHPEQFSLTFIVAADGQRGV